MSEPIQAISQGNYILQGTVATSAGIVGDGSTQNPIRADETVLFSGKASLSNISLNESITGFAYINFEYAPIDSTIQSEYNYNKLIKTISTDSIMVNKQLYLNEWFPNGSFANQLVNRTVTYNINEAATQLSYRAGWQLYYKEGAFTTRALTAGEFPIYKIVGINRKA